MDYDVESCAWNELHMHRVSSLHTCKLRYSDDSTPRASRTRYSSEIARVRSREGRVSNRLEDINLRNKRDTRSGSKREINYCDRVVVLALRARRATNIRSRNLRRLIDTRGFT